jgi:hypothetical protein
MSEPVPDTLYLEDSYFLGMLVQGPRLCFRVLFAVMPGHPAYTPPLPGEQHCYREGEIRFDSIEAVDLPNKMVQLSPHAVTIDLDRTLDLGSIGVFREGAYYRVVTDWFDLRVKAAAPEIVLEEEAVSR